MLYGFKVAGCGHFHGGEEGGFVGLVGLEALEGLLAIHLLDLGVDQDLGEDCATGFPAGLVDPVQLLLVHQLDALVEEVEQALFGQ